MTDDDLLPALDPPPPPRRGGSPVLLLSGLVLLALVGWGVGLFLHGPDKAPATPPAAPAASAPADAPTAAPTPTVDAAKVAALEAKVAAEPNDVAALVVLGDEYSLAGDAAKAKEWHGRALQVRPDDPDLLLAYGVDLFNLEDYAGAVTQWQRVTELRPGDIDAWYNLGWAHLQADPPDMVEVERAWRKVVEIDPGSKLAKTVASHLPGAPTASASPTG